MDYLLAALTARISALVARLKDGEDHGGISTETVIVVAVLAVLAIAVGAIITNLVISKANSIHL
jgi:hypothetical protein